MGSYQNFRSTPSTKQLVAVLTILTILVLWFWLYHPVFSYLGTIFTHQEFRTNQIVLLAVTTLIVLQVRRGGFRLALPEMPQMHMPALLLALIGSAAFVLVERSLDINTLSASLFGLASYGLLGLWMDPRKWRQGIPAALLLVGVLPFGDHMDTFIGYPLRLATARIVSQGVTALGIQNVGVDTILIFENGISQVDSPCSGVKSLWTGALFFLAATWIERRPVNRRWFLALACFVLILLTSNLARVAVLILVGQVMGWELFAKMLHVPLGVIGFTVACAAGIGMLNWVGSMTLPQLTAKSMTPRRSKWLAPALVLSLLGLVFLYTPRPPDVSAASFEWKLPPGLGSVDWPLSSGEMKWISNDGALPVSATRMRFKWQDLNGSLLLIASDTWRAHHRPERCFTVYGLEVQESRLYMVEPDFPLRWLTLGKARDQDHLYTAGYWLQSSQHVTDDYSARMWDDITSQSQEWVLVTVLFDKPIDLTDANVESLFMALRHSVQQSLDDAHP